MEQQFSTEEVAARTGMSPRQLQWWDERGIVRPLRVGHRRVYCLQDLAEVAVIAALRHRGFSLQKVRKVMRHLQREFGKRLAETVTAGSDYHLLTDGRRIYLETSPQQVIDVLKNARQPMFAICLSDTVRQVRAELHPPPDDARTRRAVGAPDARRAERSAKQQAVGIKLPRRAGVMPRSVPRKGRGTAA